MNLIENKKKYILVTILMSFLITIGHFLFLKYLGRIGDIQARSSLYINQKDEITIYSKNNGITNLNEDLATQQNNQAQNDQTQNDQTQNCAGDQSIQDKTGSGYVDQFIAYKKVSLIINGRKQVIYIIDADMSIPGTKIQPVLSFDLIYGFEYLSSMYERYKPIAAVNGGFFYEYGEPAGMVMVDGELYTKPTGKYPVLIAGNSKVSMTVPVVDVYAEGDDTRIKADDINSAGNLGTTVFYTPVFGSSNRAKYENITVTVINETIVEIKRCKAETKIPRDGFLLTFYLPHEYEDEIPLKKGDYIELKYNPDKFEELYAYECGCWLIKDGKMCVGERDPWIGVLTNRDPRTAVGIIGDSRIVMIVVDGRQPGYSEGLTANELALFMLEYGVENAAMLDGGASTEMIYKGEIVNHPSYKGRERKLAGGIIFSTENE